MSSIFKCLVSMNGQNYSIIINKTNDITFEDILSEIQKIDSKLNITSKTHVFEVNIFIICLNY
jgi:DNA-directed RNA polymerase delta subunit